MAAPEGEREARKRRERRDSGCSHERKERRPHSEERPPSTPPAPPLNDYNRLESERRAERLSRARRPQYGNKRRRAPARMPRHLSENDCCVPSIDTRSGTPPNFEYVVQQSPEPIACEETDQVSSVEESARQEEAERARRGERNEPPRRTQPNTDRRLEKVIKKINVLKNNIAKYEDEFESENGYPMPQDDRMTDMKLARMYVTLRRLQTEKRSMKADPVEYALKVLAAKQQKQRDDKLDAALKSSKPMSEVVIDIEEWIEGCRQASGRAGTAESEWSPAQLAAEKSCVQRALLRLEAARGRPPAHSAERGAARHLYERYRTVKRALATNRPDAIMGGANGELATIHEHETMLFNTSVDSSGEEKPSDSSQETVETPLQSPPTREVLEEMPSSTSSAQSATTSEEVTPSNEGLHCLGLEELTKTLTDAKMLKRVLRRTLKQYELDFELQNNRKVQREDINVIGHEDEYQRYKTVKARIKLITALINKQKSTRPE